MCKWLGGSEEMEELLKANPGLRSRFPTVITFANYSAPELMAICEGLLAAEQLALSPAGTEVVQGALEAVAAKAATGDRRAANGRAVRNLIEQAKRQQVKARITAPLPQNLQLF
jgi:stage V sporulation protein K